MPRITVRIFSDKFLPNPSLYEICEQDLVFLKSEVANILIPEKDLFDNPGLSEFEQLITHFENTEHKDFDSYFRVTGSRSLASRSITIKPKLPNVDLYLKGLSLFTLAVQDKVIAYWKKRQKNLRRPLLRKHWKILYLNNQGYGEQDTNKIAFAPRTSNRMNLRKGNRMLNGLPLAEKLKELREENKQALFLVKMVHQREILKRDQFLLSLNRKDALGQVNRVNNNLESCQQLLTEIKEKDFIDESPSEPIKQGIENDEQDIKMFLCNLVTELGKMGLSIENLDTKYRDTFDTQILELKEKAETIEKIVNKKRTHYNSSKGNFYYIKISISIDTSGMITSLKVTNFSPQRQLQVHWVPKDYVLYFFRNAFDPKTNSAGP